MPKHLRIYKLGLVLAFLFFGIANAYSQERTITGTVTDAETGETLIGVNVTHADDASKGAVTDIDGNYTITVPESLEALRFSFVGYTPQVIPITGNVINVTLLPGQELSEIVVVGYGTQKTREVTSAVTSVKEEDFNDGNVVDPIQLIQGKVAGLQIAKPGNGDPNSDFTIRLRGLSTLGSNTQPLIVIDGIIGADLKSVDPSDIISMDVLKDASATSIYGTRGASGVILITTKTGEVSRDGKGFNVDFGMNFTTEHVARKVDVLSAEDYRSLSNSTDFGTETDWFDELTRNGFSQAYNLAISGADAKTNYRVAFNYRSGDATILKTGYEQINGRLNFQHKTLNDMLTFSLNLAANQRTETYTPSEAFSFATRYNPTAPVREDTTAFSQEWGGFFQRNAFSFFNPVAVVEQSTLDGRKMNIVGSGKVDFQPIDGLNISAQYSQDRRNNVFGAYWSKYALYTPYATGSHKGFARKELHENFDQLFETFATYEHKFAEKYTVKVLGGYSWQERNYENFFAFGSDYLSDAFLYHSIGSAASKDLKNSDMRGSYKNKITNIGFFGRVNFNYNDAVFFAANIRRDGSSMFGEDKQWGLFPGFSLGVDITKFVVIPGFDRLKVRGGYGEVGNLPGSPYLSKDLWGVGGGSFFYQGSYIQAYEPWRNQNANLQWEVKRETSIGLDLAFLDYKLKASIDYFSSKSSELIMESTVPSPPYYASTMYFNIGELTNSGLEFAMDYLAVDNGNFSWTTNVNFTYYIGTKLNKITSPLTTNESTLYFGDLGAPGLVGTRTIIAEEGEYIGSILAPIYLYTDTTGTMMYRSQDTSLAGETSTPVLDDYETVGSGLPDFTIGWGNTFTYKNFTVSFFLRGVFGHSLINVNNAKFGVPVIIGIQSGMNQIKDFADATNGPVYSNVHVEKADFVKLDNFSIGYNFNLPDNKYVDGVNVFLSGQNLFTITNYGGVDPEVRFTDGGNPLAPGIDRENTYFSTRSFTLGVNVLF